MAYTGYIVNGLSVALNVCLLFLVWRKISSVADALSVGSIRRIALFATLLVYISMSVLSIYAFFLSPTDYFQDRAINTMAICGVMNFPVGILGVIFVNRWLGTIQMLFAILGTFMGVLPYLD